MSIDGTGATDFKFTSVPFDVDQTEKYEDLSSENIYGKNPFKMPPKME